MAHHCTSISVPNKIDEAFRYVSDFRHAVWDPRVLRASKISNGPLGLGAQFELNSRFLLITFGLPYTIVVYDPPYRLELVGTTAIVGYRDAISFAPSGDGTEITYCADLTLRSVFKMGVPFLQLAFPGICRDATWGLKKALEEEFTTT